MNKAYSSRIAVIFFIFCFLYFAIVLNLFFIQIIHQQFYVRIGKSQYETTCAVEQQRATIIDRTGQFLALNKESVAAFILPRYIENNEKVTSFLQNYFPTALQRLQSHERANFLYIKRRLTQQEIDRIAEADFSDIKLLYEPSRYYPLSCAGAIIGATDIDNKGLFGIELSFDKQLAGQPTVAFLEKDARSGHFYFERQTKDKGCYGKVVQLTLDSDLQFFAHEELLATVKQYDAKEGMVIIMDPSSGDILVMAQTPCFDPNNSAELALDQTKNKVVADAYELGSVFKVFAALAALEEGIVACDELIDCGNQETVYIQGRKINTVKSSIRGSIPFSQVIAVSNNIGIALVAQRLGTALYDHYKRLGFGNKTGLPLPGEARGFVNDPAHWSKQSIFSLSYGYEVSATLLQLARAFSIIANDGCDVIPRIILHAPLEQGKRLYKHETIEVIRSILEMTTVQGTAKKAAIKGYRVMSKTGTANMLVNGQYDTTKNIYTCAGIVEKDSYKRVIVTCVKEAEKQNLYASQVAAPLLERIAQRMLIHDKIL
ncbi:MAG: penicillin-binding protein 2 [Candidatus Dependentiae bacterium]|nr:penicillin-binding protein 2 [Candidatus Dependentiae bacterium]